MKKQILTLMIGTAVFLTSPVLGMEEEDKDAHRTSVSPPNPEAISPLSTAPYSYPRAHMQKDWMQQKELEKTENKLWEGMWKRILQDTERYKLIISDDKSEDK